MKQPRQWRNLERHLLSQEYDDITGDAWAQYVTGVREFGVINGRKVIVEDGKVIDGWQLQRACVEAGKKPVYASLKLPKGMTVEQWVETVNDNRRHETAESIQDRAEKRRERVAERRRHGESTRTIAEAENVSQMQVLRDLKTVTDTGVSVNPSDGKITGKDNNREQPASKPKPPPKPAPPESNERTSGIDRLAKRGLVVGHSMPQTSAMHLKAQAIIDAIHGVHEALQTGVESSDAVLRTVMEKQRKRLAEVIIPDMDILLDRPAVNGKPASREERNALFDAVVEITGADAKASGAHVSKVVKLLLTGEPPYTADEVKRLPAEFKKAGWKTIRVTVGMVEKYIGWVRKNQSDAGDGMFDSLKRFVERHQ